MIHLGHLVEKFYKNDCKMDICQRISIKTHIADLTKDTNGFYMQMYSHLAT